MAISYEMTPCLATNVLHFLCHETGGLGASDVQDTVQHLADTWLDDFWKHVASSSAHSTVVEATYALIEGQPNVKRVRIADARTGLEGATPEYGQTAYLVNWDTGDARRGGKPRTYVFGCAEDGEADPANVSSAILTAGNSGLATWISDVEGSTHGALVVDHLVEYSTVNRNAYRTAGATFTISNGTMNPVIATQRRRVDRLRST